MPVWTSFFRNLSKSYMPTGIQLKLDWQTPKICNEEIVKAGSRGSDLPEYLNTRSQFQLQMHCKKHHRNPIAKKEISLKFRSATIDFLRNPRTAIGSEGHISTEGSRCTTALSQQLHNVLYEVFCHEEWDQYRYDRKEDDRPALLL